MSQENNQEKEQIVSTGNWFIFLIILTIPIIGIIVVIVEAISGSNNRNKRNLCRAMILWGIINTIGIALLASLFWTGITKFISNLEQSGIDVQQESNMPYDLDKLSEKLKKLEKELSNQNNRER